MATSRQPASRQPASRQPASLPLKAEEIEKFRALCLALPETTETNSWGHPNFKAGGKMFASCSEYGYGFKAHRDFQEMMLKDPRFTSKYNLGDYGWLILKADGGKIDWEEIQDLLLRSYKLVAKKKLLAALEARTGTSPPLQGLSEPRQRPSKSRAKASQAKSHALQRPSSKRKRA